jgi:hypothetical protein
MASVSSDRRARSLPWLRVWKMRELGRGGVFSGELPDRSVAALTVAARPDELQLERIRPGAPGPDFRPENYCTDVDKRPIHR